MKIYAVVFCDNVKIYLEKKQGHIIEKGRNSNSPLDLLFFFQRNQNISFCFKFNELLTEFCKIKMQIFPFQFKKFSLDNFLKIIIIDKLILFDKGWSEKKDFFNESKITQKHCFTPKNSYRYR